MATVSAEIFKAYDIRGIVDQSLTLDTTKLIGKAIATIAIKKGIKTIAIGRDGRLSGKSLSQTIIDALIHAGLNVLDLGMVATPMLYFASHQYTDGSGIMITGSHNPPEYNGFKMMLAGDTLSGPQIQDLLKIIQEDRFQKIAKSGHLSQKNIEDEYINHIVSHIQLNRKMNIVIDAGNGIAGAFAGKLYRKLGCEVKELFCEVDGNFPNHHPDPAKPENLKDLIDVLHQDADIEIGLAFDGDGDRLGVVTKDGNIIWPDRQLMLFAEDVLSRNPNAKIIYDVKCTRLLAGWIHQHGGQPILSKTGHSFIKAKIKEERALLAGEMSGHLFFKERWFGFDDGLYAGVRLLEILSRFSHPSEVLNKLPNALSTPEINIKLEKEGENHLIIKKLQTEVSFPNAKEVITIDGLRVEYEDGFGLIRASNTTPVLVLRFEADSQEALEKIQSEFKQLLLPYGIDYKK